MNVDNSLAHVPQQSPTMKWTHRFPTGSWALTSHIGLPLHLGLLVNTGSGRVLLLAIGSGRVLYMGRFVVFSYSGSVRVHSVASVWVGRPTSGRVGCPPPGWVGCHLPSSSCFRSDPLLHFFICSNPIPSSYFSPSPSSFSRSDLSPSSLSRSNLSSFIRSDPSSVIVAFLFATFLKCQVPIRSNPLPSSTYPIRAHISDLIRNLHCFLKLFQQVFTPFDDVFDHSNYWNQSQSISYSHSNMHNQPQTSFTSIS